MSLDLLEVYKLYNLLLIDTCETRAARFRRFVVIDGSFDIIEAYTEKKISIGIVKRSFRLQHNCSRFPNRA